MTRVPFISLDGIDGTGKSTQIQLLADWFRTRGWHAVTCADPGGTPLGDRLRQILLNERGEIGRMAEALLFMTSRAELIERVIRPALAAGAVVLSDRYLLANVVYQGHGAGLDVGMLWTMGILAASELLPDLTIVLDLSLDQALQRRGRAPDRMEERQREFHERVHAGFLSEAARSPDRICIVSAEGGIDEVHRRIVAEVERVLGPCTRA